MEEAKRRAAVAPADSWLVEEPARISKDPKPAVASASAQATQSTQAEAPSPASADPVLAVDLEQDMWADLVPFEESPAVQAPPPLPVTAAPSSRGAAAQPRPVTPAPTSVAPAVAASPFTSKPPRPGPDARQPAEEDLWRIVSFDDDASNLSASFEAALSKAESHLESLVQAPGGDVGEPPVEAIVEATIEPVPSLAGFPSPPGDKEAATGQTALDTSSGGVRDDGLDGLDDLSDLDDWDFDEDDVAGDPSNPDEEARQRRQRLLRRAMENMGSLGARADGPVGAVPVSPAAHSGTGPAAPSAPVSEPPAPAAEDAGLVQQIERRYAELQNKRDHFATLGVTPESPRDQVKAAFLSLAKVFHPDRLPPSVPHLAPKITSVFEAIREAYEILYDDAKRAAYVEALKKAAAPKPPAAPSAPGVSPAGRGNSASNPVDLFKMGEVFFRKRDFTAAIDHLERAYALDPKPVYLATLAWALYMDPQRKAEIPKAKQMMADAVKADPGCDRAHYQLGVIARVEGDNDRAERHFREAVRANPKHLEANQELRLIEMRKKNTPAPKKGFFR
ncbi:MAG: DnaJ domain-containing protein [Myxococcaceae bacterium]|nr:DnaJ domain-containing protein [Myxococcaceae bacterium]